jgi:hypothetical protein
MEKQLNKEDMQAYERKERADKGGRHVQPKHGNFRVGQYDITGKLEAEYDSLYDAVDNNKIGATYAGILACVEGRAHRHRKKIWRKEPNNE